MSDVKAKQEPSMEEILASIRQIISDDADGPRRVGAMPADPDPAGDVLELTEMMNDDGTVTDLSRHGAFKTAAAAVSDALATTGDKAAEVPAAGREPASEDDAGPTAPAGGIVSKAAAGDVAQALGGLAHKVGGSRQMPLGAGGKTLENLVKELLRPMLKAWLDEHLPPLVERLVEKEIRRISNPADET